MSETDNHISLNNVRRVGHLLGELLNLLYPPPLKPDIITLQDVLIRYRLTGLGVPAITALQQSQRILRAGKDYSQIGLCEFHIGLIYLHWGHCLAAAQQFAEARRQWSFTDETAPVCLSYFAQGQAQHLALHYEPAMGCYQKTDQWLPRLKLSPLAAQLDGFVPQLTALLKEARETLREKMWPPDEPERITEPAGMEETTAVPAPPASTPPTTTETETAESAPIEPSPTLPPPPETIVFEAPTPQEPHPDSPSPLVILPPIIQSGAAAPPSVLIPIRESYKWYRVTERQGDFLPHVRNGGWLLVDTQVREKYQKNDLIIIGGDLEQIQGSIRVEPYTHPPTYKRIFLSRVQHMEGSFVRDEVGRVTFTSGSRQESIPIKYVLGIVLGFWLNPLQISA